MSSDRRKTQEILETSDLVPMPRGGGTYAYVSPRRSKRTTAGIVEAPVRLEFEDDAPTSDIRPIAAHGTPPHGTPSISAGQNEDVSCPELRFVPQMLELRTPAAAPVVRLDPDLCSCPKMLGALASGIVMVVVDGPVSLSPGVLREETLFKGDFNLDSIERSYDGKPWAFRHCPFKGCLIDAQIEVLPQVTNMCCCGTMEMAVLHGRIELPAPERYDREFSKFVDPGRTSAIFSYCPWCATDMIDLAVARYKRSHGR